MRYSTVFLRSIVPAGWIRNRSFPQAEAQPLAVKAKQAGLPTNCNCNGIAAVTPALHQGDIIYRFFTTAIVVLSVTLATNASIINVYSGESIQTAIDNAVGDDAIPVHPGMYFGCLNLTGKDITLKSADGPGAVAECTVSAARSTRQAHHRTAIVSDETEQV